MAPNPARAFPTRKADSLHVLLLTTGSVASVKAPLIVEELLSHENTCVQVVSTKPSLHFFDGPTLEKRHADDGVKVWSDEDEWNSWSQMGDPILHIELRRWADVVLLAPCSANTLSKIASGSCDNVLTSLLRALPASTPKLLFPAMNTLMYTHPHTSAHLGEATKLGWEVGEPAAKALACGDVGLGAMMDWRDICVLVVSRWGLVRKAGMPPAPVNPLSAVTDDPPMDGITAAPNGFVKQTGMHHGVDKTEA